MRVSGELARMADLARVLPFATADMGDARREALRTRINQRSRWAEQLTDHPNAFEDWHAGAETADQLVDEVIAMLMTRLMRSEGMDVGAFDAAGLLLSDLTVLAGVPPLLLVHTQRLESVDHHRAAVSVRFPGTRIWELPFVAHEFGHHATTHVRHREPALADRRPLAEVKADVVSVMKKTQPPNAFADPHAGELLADCVATVSCGPTVPIACLCLRVLRTAKAGTPTSTHPSWRDRIATMSEVLNALADASGKPRYRQQREAVIDPLAAAVLGSVPAVPPAGLQAAQRVVTAVWDHVPALVYHRADDAIEVMERLERRDPTAAADTAVSAVVDGAWRWRLSRLDRTEDDEVARLAVDYCRQLR